jgi:DNA-binding MarR family transcriptional regulator
MERNFTNHIGHHIMNISRNLTNAHNEKLEKYGITYAQLRILNCLWDKDGLTQKEILEIVRIKSSTITGIIDVLEKKGLAIRKLDKVDGRIRHVYLTNEGEALKMNSWEICLELEDRLSKTFSVEEKLLLLSWLRIISDNIK